LYICKPDDDEYVEIIYFVFLYYEMTNNITSVGFVASEKSGKNYIMARYFYGKDRASLFHV